jgi:hypothetical protein
MRSDFHRSDFVNRRLLLLLLLLLFFPEVRLFVLL